MTTETVNLRPCQAGGHATLVKHGSAHYSRIGRLGGRPRLQVTDNTRRLSASSTPSKKRREDWHGRASSLRELKRLYAESEIGQR